MSGGFQVDPESLRAAARQLGTAVEGFDELVDRFVGEIESYGAPWGGDDLGTLIGVAHGAVLDAAMDCCDDNLDAMESYVEALTGAAESYDAVESANAQSLTSFSW